MKISKTGAQLWKKNYGGSYNQQFYAVPILLNDGSIVCAGYSNIISGFAWGYLVKTDSAGNEIWHRTYYETSSSTQDYFYDVKQTSDNGFIMSGLSTNGWLVKVDSAGCDIANCNVGINEFEFQGSPFNVFPNPAGNEIDLSIEGENLNDYEISIINVLGEIQKIKMHQSTISVSGFSSGIYFIYALSREGKQRLVQKFVKE